MRFCRATIISFLVLAALALLGPAGALAGGPSAGDQQYVDPLGGSSTSHSHSSKPSSSSSSGSQQSSAPAPAAQGSSSAATSATSASTTTSSSAAPSAADPLPRTGYDSWLAVAVGIGMLGTGLVLRRRVRRQ